MGRKQFLPEEKKKFLEIKRKHARAFWKYDSNETNKHEYLSITKNLLIDLNDILNNPEKNSLCKKDICFHYSLLQFFDNCKLYHQPI